MFTPFQKSSSIFSTISIVPDGSMKNQGEFNSRNIEKFARKHTIDPGRIVLMNQVHSANVAVVEDLSERIFEQTDGLITSQQRIFLGVVTADCLPVVFFDAEKQVIAAIHAGYKGLLNNIIANTVEKMSTRFDVSPKNLHVGVGPSIHSCCYAVGEDRAKLFTNLLPNHSEILSKREGQLFLDLQMSAKLLLLSCTIPAEQIKISSICTQDTTEYFSYRRSKTAVYGEMLTLIGQV